MTIVFDNVSAKNVISKLLKIPVELFQIQTGYVKYKSYTEVYIMGNIKIYTSCMVTDANPYGLGSYMTISGSGCDQLQMYLRTQNRTIEDMFKECSELYGKYFHFTRLDVAIDDRNPEPFFTMEQIKEKCLSREFLSKSRNFRFNESNFQDGSTALTVYIGDRKSKLSYRFYDKDKEQAGKTKY